jgi:hypothetical protein
VLEQRLEVDVPDPRHVLAVGDRVVERDDENGGTRLQRAHDLVRSGRVLDQEQHDDLPPARIRSKRPNAALNRASPRARPRATRRRASASARAAVAL